MISQKDGGADIIRIPSQLKRSTVGADLTFKNNKKRLYFYLLWHYCFVVRTYTRETLEHFLSADNILFLKFLKVSTKERHWSRKILSKLRLEPTQQPKNTFLH